MRKYHTNQLLAGRLELSMRKVSRVGIGATLAAICLGLGGCDGVALPDKMAEVKARSHGEAMAKAESRIECAGPGEQAMALTCTITRTQTQDGLFLTLRHADGGFRRLLVTTDGRGVVAADGAERAVVTPVASDLIEVRLGGARYHLPATVRATPKPPSAGSGRS